MKAPSQNLLVACAAGLALAYVVSLASLFAAHNWLLDARGRPLVTDFLALWSAGGLAHGGTPVLAYDVHVHHAAEVAAIGHEFHGGLGWLYPPFFLFAAAGFAMLGYAQAFILWVVATIAAHAAVIGTIARRRAAALFALVAPWTLANAMIGQTGFLTAALFGAVLLFLETSPALSGILLGLLTYKPQFGLLFPIALIFGGHWRVFGWAAVTALFLIGLSGLAFGASSWIAFLQTLPQISHQVLVEGGVGWNKMQSVYGFARWLGWSDMGGWVVQGTVTALCAGGMGFLWRADAGAALKAAGLAAAALLATPYVFLYDLPMLAVAIAFLYRDRAFDRIETGGVAFALLAACAFVVVPMPSGLFGVLTVAGMVARRTLALRAAAHGNGQAAAIPVQ